MSIYLFLLPFFIILFSLFLIRFNGRREVMRIDFVQFVYCFVLVPLMFIWFKSFLFNLFKQELNVSMSFRDVMVIDTIFSVVFLFISSFVVIHSLAKTFNLKKQQDPLYDLNELTEYFHLTFSHFTIYGGALLSFVILSLINVLMPFTFPITKVFFYVLLGLGMLAGVLFLFTVRSYKSASRRFLKIMKLFYGLGFIVHMIIYLATDLQFSSSYLLFWIFFMLFLSLVINSLFFSLMRRNKEIGRPYVRT